MKHNAETQTIMSHQEDRFLASRLADGDEEALQCFFDRFADPLFAFIYHRIEPNQGTEDVWQETLIAAVNSIASYRGESQLFTWLCGLARHKIADYYRKHGRYEELVSETSLEMAHHLLAQQPLPEEAFENKGIRLLVIAVLADLPADYREALVWRYAEGESVGQIAERLGRSYKATESLLGRAREAFKGIFQNMEADHG